MEMILLSNVPTMRSVSHRTALYVILSKEVMSNQWEYDVETVALCQLHLVDIYINKKCHIFCLDRDDDVFLCRCGIHKRNRNNRI